MQQLSKWQLVLQQAGGLMVVVGAALHIVWPMVSVVVYGIGAVAFAYTQLCQRYDGHDMILLRLRRQQLFGAALLVVTAPAMVLRTHNEWVVCLTIACILELYTAWRIPTVLKKKK